MTDPRYFVVQLVLFPIAAVLFGIFLRALWREIAENGWVLTPRCVYHVCLCISSGGFWVLQLDPSSCLGIYPTPWRAVLGILNTSLLLNSSCASFYLYVVVLFARHLAKVSPWFTNLLISANAVATIFTALIGLGGLVTGNAFWLGVTLVILMFQEVVIVIMVHVSLHKVGLLLQELQVSTKTSYRAQRRKIWIIRIVTTLIATVSIANMLSQESSEINALAAARPIRELDYENFQFDDAAYPMPDILIALAHLALLYGMNRPTGNNTKHVSLNVSSSSASSSSTGRV